MAIDPIGHDTVRTYLGQIGRLGLLTREGELEIAKRIELGEHAVIGAVVATDAGARQIRLLGDRLRSGKVRVKDLVRGASDDDEGWEEQERARVLDLMSTVGRFAARRERAETKVRPVRAPARMVGAR